MTTPASAIQELDGSLPSTSIDPLDVSARLNELRGENMPRLDWLVAAFARWYPRDLPRPFLFAAADGRSLQATWSLPPYAPSLDIDLGRRTAVWHDTGRGVDLSAVAGWSSLSETLREMTGDAVRWPAGGC